MEAQEKSYEEKIEKMRSQMEQNKAVRETNKAAFDAKLAKEQTKTLEAKSLAKKF